ncbi:MAG: UDP-N-acetylmuramate--L-alanine ligase [Patescibacteria group bacterium]
MIKNLNLNRVKKVHFIGIGGIGQSAAARLLLNEGKIVTGSDHNPSPVTDGLVKKGIKILIGQKADNITADTDLLVYSLAVPEDNPERLQGQELNIPEVSYPELLGLISENKKTVAVAGTHGKTTTTAMLGEVLNQLKPSVIVGSLLTKTKSNFIAGEGKWLVVEACEYKRSFLNLKPTVLVITNIEEDHLDYYKDLTDIQSAFKQLAEKVPADGLIIAPKNNPNLKSILATVSAPVIDYSDISIPQLQVPGRHNLLDAQAAKAVGLNLNIPESEIDKALINFKGTWRRLEYKGQTTAGAVVYDDYAHHPTEIKMALTALKVKYPNKQLVAVFQPHLYSRTRDFMDKWSIAFEAADQVIVLPIYAAREKPLAGINSQALIKQLGVKAQLATDFRQAKELLENKDAQTVIAVLGAGDIFKLSEDVIIGF